MPALELVGLRYVFRPEALRPVGAPFCYVANVVQANLIAATPTRKEAIGQVFNVACGDLTTLNGLFRLIRDRVARVEPTAARSSPRYRGFRPGDVRHSHADIGRARSLLGYSPTHLVEAGLDCAAAWYVDDAKPARKGARRGPGRTGASGTS